MKDDIAWYRLRTARWTNRCDEGVRRATRVWVDGKGREFGGCPDRSGELHVQWNHGGRSEPVARAGDHQHVVPGKSCVAGLQSQEAFAVGGIGAERCGNAGRKRHRGETEVAAESGSGNH